MQLEHAHLHERDERGDRIRHHVQRRRRRSPAPSRARAPRSRSRRRASGRSTASPSRSGSAPASAAGRAGAAGSSRAIALVVPREVALGDARFRVEHLVRIAEPDAGDALRRRLSRLARASRPFVDGALPRGFAPCDVCRARSCGSARLPPGARSSRAVSAGRSRTTSFGILVLAQALERRMAQRAVVGPLGELDLARRARASPSARPRFGAARRIAERRAPSSRALAAACAAIASVASLKPVPTLPA